jgi:hypothetical protein
LRPIVNARAEAARLKRIDGASDPTDNYNKPQRRRDFRPKQNSLAGDPARRIAAPGAGLSMHARPALAAATSLNRLSAAHHPKRGQRPVGVGDGKPWPPARIPVILASMRDLVGVVAFAALFIAVLIDGIWRPERWRGLYREHRWAGVVRWTLLLAAAALLGSSLAGPTSNLTSAIVVVSLIVLVVAVDFWSSSNANRWRRH